MFFSLFSKLFERFSIFSSFSPFKSFISGVMQHFYTICNYIIKYFTNKLASIDIIKLKIIFFNTLTFINNIFKKCIIYIFYNI